LNIEEAINELLLLLNIHLNDVISYREEFKIRMGFLRVVIEYEKLKRDEYC